MADQVRTARLVRRARRGDEEAFRQLLEAHQEAIATTLYACGVRDSETARDLAQDTALKAWQRLASLRQVASFSPWIRQIAANAARDFLRQRASRFEEGLETVAELEAGDDPHRDAVRRLEIRQMRMALSEEEESQLELLSGRAEGVPVRELADRMGISEDALKMRLLRLRKRLRRRLDEIRGSD